MQVLDSSNDDPISFEVGAGDVVGNKLFQVRKKIGSLGQVASLSWLFFTRPMLHWRIDEKGNISHETILCRGLMRLFGA